MSNGIVTGLHQVFVKETHHLVIPDEQCSFETLENLKSEGFELVWDSAPSEFKGAQYAAQNYGAPVPVEKGDFDREMFGVVG